MIAKFLIPIAVLGVSLVWPGVMGMGGLPTVAAYLPDLVSALSLAWLMAALIATGRWARIPVRYWLSFIGFVYVVAAGAVLNNVSGDTIFAGIRVYFRYLSLFLLPFVYHYSGRDIGKILIFLACLMVLQLPLTVWQRFVSFAATLHDGDKIAGTLSSTSSLAILSAFAILTAVALYVDRLLGLALAGILCLLIIVPSALSEAKATPVFAAFGAAIVCWCRRDRFKFSQMLTIGIVGGVVLAGFVYLYNQIYQRDGVDSYAGTMTNVDALINNYNYLGVEALPFQIPKKSKGYMVAEAQPQLERDVPELGRFDSITMPFHALFPHELSYLALGLGIGNVDTTFGSGGDYLEIENILSGTHTGLAMLIWELGLFGAFFYLMFLVTVARDALRASRADGVIGAFAVSSWACFLIAILTLAYANMFHLPEIAMVLHFQAGIVAAHLALEHREEVSDEAAVIKDPPKYLVTQRDELRPT